jgi:hypothetical protein
LKCAADIPSLQLDHRNIPDASGSVNETDGAALGPMAY